MDYFKELVFRYYKRKKKYLLEDSSNNEIASIRYTPTILSKQKSTFEIGQQDFSIRSESIWKIRAGVYRLGAGDEEEQIAEIRYDIWRNRMELYFINEERKFFLRQKGFMRFRYELEDIATKQKIAIIRPTFKFTKLSYRYTIELYKEMNYRDPQVLILLMTSFFGARLLLERAASG